MNRISSAFAQRDKRSLLIPFLTAGDPTYDLSLQLFDSVLQAGADMVEIGVPYSDPLADGPVIQAASLRSLRAGFTLPMAFEMTTALRQRHPDKPLILFTYMNPVLQYTPQRFLTDAAVAGADGIIIPDLPLEESRPFRRLARERGLASIPLVTPVTPPHRLASICEEADGFIYCVAALGVTGMRASVSERVESMVESVKSLTDLPVAVGFGVSSGEQAKALSSYADGVIVGSAIIRRLEEVLQRSTENAHVPEEIIRQEVIQFTETLTAALQ